MEHTEITVPNSCTARTKQETSFFHCIKYAFPKNGLFLSSLSSDGLPYSCLHSGRCIAPGVHVIVIT